MTPKRRILERKEKATRTSVVGICGQERRYWTTLLFYVKKLSGVKKGQLCVEDKHNLQGKRGVHKLDDTSMKDLVSKRGRRIRKGSKRSQDALCRNNQLCVTNLALKGRDAFNRADIGKWSLAFHG